MPTEVSQVLLLGLLGIPLLAGLTVALMGPRRERAIPWVSLGATLVCLLLAVGAAGSLASLPGAATGSPAKSFHPEFETRLTLLRLGPGAVEFYIGLDGLNVWLVVLTALLMVPSVLVSWASVTERVNEYYAWLLTLETAMLGVFLAFDIILFYVFFELTLVPLYFLIGTWGGPERRHAASKFFIYTLAGSLITFLGVLGVVLACYTEPRINRLTFALPELVGEVNKHLAELGKNPAAFAKELAAWQHIQFWVFLALMTGFAVKVPLVPLHTWLPLAHVEAPTAGSVLLAGVLLKIGCYGFLRLCLPLAPDASVGLGVPLIGMLAVAGILYGAGCALAQDDIKRLVAYSSVSHLGFCMLGMFALNEAGLSGSLLQMINHGLSTGALFLLVGMLYDRYHTRRLSAFGGLGARLGLLTFFMVFISLSSIGLPFLNGFIGEVLVLMGMFAYQGPQVNGPLLASVGAIGIVLGAWYLLSMLRSAFFGPAKEPAHEDHAVGDLNFRELAALAPIAVLCVALGVYPQPFLRVAGRDVQVVARIAGDAMQRSPSYTRQEATPPASPQAAVQSPEEKKAP
jgi:NADH-quinone oxidoreductase subunit M